MPNRIEPCIYLQDSGRYNVVVMSNRIKKTRTVDTLCKARQLRNERIAHRSNMKRKRKGLKNA